MNDYIMYLGILVSILGFLFAFWQWRQRLKIEQIQIQNLRSIWDIARSYAPYTIDLESVIARTDDKEIIAMLTKLTEGLSSVTRFVTPMYGRSLKKKLTYDYIKCMIIAGAIGGTWSLGLILAEVPTEERNPDKEAELIKLLPECRKNIIKSRMKIEEAVIALHKSRKKIIENNENKKG